MYIGGVDSRGLDVFSRTITGTRNSLFIGVASIAIGFLVGGACGIAGGYFKGKIGGFVGFIMDIALAFPPLVLALSIVTFLGRSVSNVTIALAIVSSPILYRIARASTLSWSEREFVLACRAQGGKHFRIMTKEILPNVVSPIVIKATLDVSFVILLGSSLAFLGIGAQEPTPDWGAMVARGRTFLPDHWWMSTMPGLAIFVAVMGFNLLGDALRDALDVWE